MTNVMCYFYFHCDLEVYHTIPNVTLPKYGDIFVKIFGQNL